MLRHESILVLEDEAQIRALIGRVLEPFADVIGVGSLAHAREVIAARRWAGIIVDVTLPDGSGLEWLGEARETAEHLKTVPALVLSAHCTSELVNRAFAVGASYLCKPFVPEDLMTFARRTGTPAALGSALSHAVTTLAEKHRLTAREVDLVAATVHGVPRKGFLASRGISVNTYKSQVRSALRKIRARSLGEVRDAVLRGMTG